MKPVWYVIYRNDGQYWTGRYDEYSSDISQAKLFKEYDIEMLFIYPNEEWMPLKDNGDA